MKKYKGFIIGFICATFLTGIFGNSVIASIKQYIMNEATYPILINGEEYKSDDLPVLAWEGNTYVPLRAFSDITGTEIQWNSELKQVELSSTSCVITDKSIVDESKVIVDEEKRYIEAPIELGKFYTETGGVHFVEFDGKKYIRSDKVKADIEDASRLSGWEKYKYRISLSALPCKIRDKADNDKILLDNVNIIWFINPDMSTTIEFIDYDIYINQILPLLKQD